MWNSGGKAQYRLKQKASLNRTFTSSSKLKNFNSIHVTFYRQTFGVLLDVIATFRKLPWAQGVVTPRRTLIELNAACSLEQSKHPLLQTCRRKIGLVGMVSSVVSEWYAAELMGQLSGTGGRNKRPTANKRNLDCYFWIVSLTLKKLRRLDVIR